MKPTLRFSVACLALTFVSSAYAGPGEKWTPEEAKTWYGQQRWLMGANFLPRSAINQLEMWQADTWNPAQIDEELGWAAGLGMNTMRVFLHDLLWEQDKEGFKKRIDEFLKICEKHKIKPMLVLFDSCWDPESKLGKQREPRPGIHNSGWVKSPSDKALFDESRMGHFEAYVKGVVGAFGQDSRVLCWDVWNEPDNPGGGEGYPHTEEKKRIARVAEILPKAFAWTREMKPLAPVTSGPWRNPSWAPGADLNAVEKIQLDESDVITFHSYDPPKRFEERIKQLEPYNRPMICTEYMARPMKSTFEGILPLAKQYNVGMINWGFVEGKSQTFYPWDSWKKPYIDAPPAVWFHDIFKGDGTPYRPAEVELIKKMTAEAEANFKK